MTREPGGTKSAEMIRNLILKDYFNKSSKEKFDKYTDTLLYLAARNEHVKNKIFPSLKKNGNNLWQVCWLDDSLSSLWKKINFNFVNTIHKSILNGLKPDLTFILKVSSKSSKKRLIKRKTKNRYDNFSQSFYNNVQKSFLKIAKDKKHYFILDSSKNDDSLEKIFNITSKYLNIK